MQQRKLSSWLTAGSMALGVALMTAILLGQRSVEENFALPESFDVIVGGKGGDLQLVLNAFFHLDNTGTPIAYTLYRTFKEAPPYNDPDPEKDIVNTAIPYCLGDSYEVEGTNQRFRIVATIPELFDVPLAPGRSYQFAEGRNMAQGEVPCEMEVDELSGTAKFTLDDQKQYPPGAFYEAVLGSFAALQTGLKVGDTFQPVHGISGGGDRHDAFTVVGILAPTGTPNDRVMFINVEGFYKLDGHSIQRDRNADDPDKPLPLDQRRVTLCLVRTNDESPDQLTGRIGMERYVNNETEGKLVFPIRVMDQLFVKIVDPLQTLLMSLAVLVIVVAGVGILVSIYNTMNDRKRDIAVMRALGARRTTVMWIILLESLLLSVIGGLGGLLLGHGVLALISPVIERASGVIVNAWQVTLWEVFLLPGLILLAALAGFLPSLTAYRTDVAKALS